MQTRLNDRVYEIEPRRIMDVAALKRRMAEGALLYWTMVKPAHAVIFDPNTQTVAQLNVFRELWGLQRSKQIRHDRYEGIYQVFLPTTPALESQKAAVVAAADDDTLFSQSSPVAIPAPSVFSEIVHFEPSI